MKVMVETDVVLDLMLDRQPEGVGTAQLLVKVESGRVSGWLAATSLCAIHYLAIEKVGAAAAGRELRKLLLLFEVAPVNRLVLEGAVTDDGFRDFDDAVVHEAALHVGAEALVTRRLEDFGAAQLPVYTPEKLGAMIDQRGRRHAEKWA